MLTIYGTQRLILGKRASRKLRLTNKFPAIICCLNESNICIELDQTIIFKMESILNYHQKNMIIIINQIEYLVKIKEIQRHAYKSKIVHMDFLRQ